MSDIRVGSPTEQRRKILAWTHVVGVNLGLLLAGIVVVELVFGEWFAPYHPPSGAIFGRTFKLEQHYYRPYKVITYVRDRYGLRGSSGPIADIELVTVGGSTTDQVFITEGETWQDVIHAREPESFALAFQRDGPVAQDRNSVRLQDGGHVGCIRTYIMVSQDRDNSGMGAQLGEQLGAGLDRFRGSPGSPPGVAAAGIAQGRSDKVAGEHNPIRLHAVDDRDGFAQGHNRKMVIIMKIAQLRDPETIPRFRQAGQRDFDRDQLRLVGFKDHAVAHRDRSAEGSPGSTQLQELSPCRE